MTDQARRLEAAETVRSGGVVIVLTETFYALAADPFRDEAVERIFAIKQRPHDKPLPLIAADRDVVRRVAPNPGPVAEALMTGFWPGSLTVVVHAAFHFSDLVSGPGGRIGVRVPPPCAARALAELSGGWLTATSANLSGDPNPDTIGRIAGSVRDAVDLVLDDGRAPGGAPSTVVEPLADGVRIIRPGAVSSGDLENFLSDALGWKSS
ncbi:MAG: L-threonylcarbamoyladenylate synthase [Desulfomonilaceae bacterium]|nr:L-threonylcarbamoyladenylate synthase [Desulfomonilaceae bacterium]